MNSSFKHVDSFFLKVTDLEESIDWYSKIFGCSVIWKNEESGFAAINLLGLPITLSLLKSESDHQPLSHAPFNIFVDSIDETHNYLKEAGVEVGEIEELYDVKWFWFKDCNGNRLEACNY